MKLVKSGKQFATRDITAILEHIKSGIQSRAKLLVAGDCGEEWESSLLH